MQFSVAHADGVIHIGEGIKLEAYLRDRDTRPQLAIVSLEDFREFWTQDLTKLTRKEPHGGISPCARSRLW